GNREYLFGVILADYVVVENLANFARGRNAIARLHQRGFILLANDIHAKFNAFVADEDRGAGDKLAHLVLAFAAERAVQRVLRIAATNLAHSILRLRQCRASTSILGSARLRFRSTDLSFLGATRVTAKVPTPSPPAQADMLMTCQSRIH